jgi:large subunit ribosomal protein L25
LTESEEDLSASLRAVGKGASHRLRQRGQVPGVVYGHGMPLPVAVDSHVARRILALPPNRVFTLKVEGGPEPLREEVRLRAVAREATTSRVLHLDFQRVLRGERLRALVPVRILGDEELRRRGLVLEHLTAAVEVEAEARQVPEHVSLDVSGMSLGEVRTVADLPLPAGVELRLPADTVVVRVEAAQVEAAPAAASPEGEEPSPEA